MKFLANENFPLASTVYLKNKGYNIGAIGIDFPGISDKEIMLIAKNEERTILTFDRDYGELIFKYGHKPPKGIIYLRLDNFEPDEPGRIIERIIMSADFNPENKLTVFDGITLRQRTY